MYCTIQIVSTVKPVYKGHSKEHDICHLWAVSLYIQVTSIFIYGGNEAAIIGSDLLYRGVL